MRKAVVRGLIFKALIPIPRLTDVTIRTETADDGFSTLSLSDDKDTLIQIAVTPEVKKILKAVCK